MTDVHHPSLDDLADLREGLLPFERSDALSTHLTTCDECSAALASLDDVETTLMANGSTTLRMPDAVSASLDDALRRASVERAGGVPSLAERRTASAISRSRTSAGSRWALAVGAAAASVVVGFTAVDLLQGDGSSSDNSATSAAVGGSTDRGQAQAPSNLSAATSPSSSGATGVTGGHSPSPTASDRLLPRVKAGTLAGYARTVTRGLDSASQTPRCRGVELAPGASAADVRWHRSLAVVVVDPTSRRATVYSCQVPPTPLFSTSY